MAFETPSAPLMARPSFGELYMPKLVTVLREGYGLAALRADAMAGITVAMIALPLSMAIAKASGTTPERGLFTAIVGGFLISALGGSRFQVGGPAGAFIVLVASAVDRHGIDGVVLATMMAGVFLALPGLLRLGTFIKFIPYPVTVGFTAGIAVIIFASQVKDLLGLKLDGKEPAAFIAKIETLARSLDTISAAAVVLSLLTIGLIVGAKKLKPHWPGMLIAVAVAAVATFAFALPVETIGSRFGGIPALLPSPHLPDFALEKVQAVLPDAVAFALLGAIESLLSAVVADGMTGRRHRSNCELLAQGAANIGASLFGGLPATGTIARTATNVRAGAHGPVAGMMHAVFLLLFMLLAAPLFAYVPLAALAGVLAVVARRMAGATGIEALADRPDAADRRAPYDPKLATDEEVVVYRLSGAFFFGTASILNAVLDRIGDRHKALVVDFSAVPFVDSTAANAIAAIARKAGRHKVRVFVTGATPAVRHALLAAGARRPQVRYRRHIEDAVIEGRSV